MEADFTGYATKAGLKCSDGLTITAEAFKHMDGMQVPLIWNHAHSKPENVLGHALLEARDDGMYAHAFFNSTPSAQHAKTLVESRDVNKLSIYANQLITKSKTVLHGVIREVSLVLAGANPGAVIDFVRIAHSDDHIEVLDDEAIIHTGLEIVVGSVKEEKTEETEKTEEVIEHADDDTVKEIFNAMSDEQKGVVHYLVAAAMEGQASEDASHSDTEDDDESEEDDSDENDEGDALTHQEGTNNVTKNVFDQSKNGEGDKGGKTLSHSDLKDILVRAESLGSMKSALEEACIKHGINDIELLFPDAKALTDRPDFDKRRTEWVASVLSGTSKTPFSRIKTLTANLTMDEARAKGYIKGTLKKEEWIGITKRTTGPTTIYKKQKLDRDDIVDISDFDVVAWLWTEIRIMLEEELARAILIGDGRDVEDEDKIKDPIGASSGDGIRSILHDHDYYAMTINTNVDDTNYLEFVDNMIATRHYWKGTGTPDFYTTELHLGKLLTLRNGDGNRLYRNIGDLAAEMRVGQIIPVEAMQSEPTVIGILVNLKDYNLGTNKGGEISTFEDFDIDYNQHKYLMETRLSGALTKLRSALIYKKVDEDDVLVVPNAPTFVSSTGVVTIVATTGVVYKNKATGATLSTGAQSAIAAGASITVVATPASGYYLADNINDEWTFTRDAA